MIEKLNAASMVLNLALICVCLTLFAHIRTMNHQTKAALKLGFKAAAEASDWRYKYESAVAELEAKK